MAEKKGFPEGKYMSAVKVGPKGQIVIPKEARDMFGIEPGDSLLLLADQGQGIALQRFDYLDEFFKNVFKTRGESPEE